MTGAALGWKLVAVTALSPRADLRAWGSPLPWRKGTAFLWPKGTGGGGLKGGGEMGLQLVPPGQGGGMWQQGLQSGNPLWNRLSITPGEVHRAVLL